MTRIAVFCDGTWNSPRITEPTSVHKLYQALDSAPTRGQVTAYFPGIGTRNPYDSKVRNFFNKWGGGAFGWGLDSKVKEAYHFLASVYQPGDEIYLFGFSRGAYTARSVAGMIRKCGIVDDTSPDGINQAFDLYRKKGEANKPDADHIWRARREMSPRFATSKVDAERRADDSPVVNIAYLGVFDTVGARGIPVSLFGGLALIWNNQYKFHDMQLSSLVRSARHALAIDERRVFFVPAKWDNLNTLNGEDTGPLRPYQQIWFVGNHAVIGGSAEDAQPIAAFPLDWIVQGGGRLTKKDGARIPPDEPNVLADSENIKHGWQPLSRWRQGPETKEEMHSSVEERIQGRTDYRPKSLARLLGKI